MMSARTDLLDLDEVDEAPQDAQSHPRDLHFTPKVLHYDVAGWCVCYARL